MPKSKGNLIIPKAALEQHTIALGKTGAGKSSAIRHIVEWLLDRKRRVVIVTPKADWWGLKLAANGKRAGYPIVVFGGENSDLPLHPKSGKALAELLATGNRSAVIQMREFMPGERSEFWIDFASTLYRKIEGKMYLVLDEVHNLAPKGRVFDKTAGMLLHWSNKLASEARGLGINLLAASQRAAKVHNDFLTSCETLIAMRVTTKWDRDAIKDWIEGCGDDEHGKEILRTLAQMKRGDAWVWSPEIEFGPKRIKFPMFKTYDSFAPQKAKRRKLKGWAEAPLKELRTKLDTFVKEVEANDPELLRKKLQNLTIALSIERKKAKDGKPTEQEPDARPILKKNERKRVFAEAYEMARHELTIAWKEEKKVLYGAFDAYVDALNVFAKNITLETKKLLDMNTRTVKELQRTDVPVMSKSEIKQLVAKAKHIPTPEIRTKTLWSEAAHKEFDGAIKEAMKDVKNGRKKPLHVSLGTPVSIPLGAMKDEAKETKVLNAIAQYNEGASLQRLAVLTGYATGTVYNAIKPLLNANLIEKDHGNYYITDSGRKSLGKNFKQLPTGRQLATYWEELLKSSEKAVFVTVIELLDFDPNTFVEIETVASKTGLAPGTVYNQIKKLRLRGLVLLQKGLVKLSPSLI